MSLTFSFLQEQVIEKSKAHDTLCTTIEHEREVIEACTENAPAVIEAFKKKFAHYQKEKTNPSLWSKIQIIAARKWGSQTWAEKKYAGARENLRSLAKKRRTATRDLRSVMWEPWTILSRDSLIEKSRDPDFTNSQSQKKSDYWRLWTAEKEEEFTDFIETEWLTETVKRLRMLDEYIATNPKYEEAMTIMIKMTDLDTKKAMKKYLLTRYGDDASKVLEILAVEWSYNSSTDSQTYWQAYEKMLKEIKQREYRNDYKWAPIQSFKFEEIVRHAQHTDIYKGIIDSLNWNYCGDFWYSDSCMQGWCFMASNYFLLPIPIQEYILHTKCLPSSLANCFGQVRIKGMSPWDAAKFILSNPRQNVRWYFSWYTVGDSFTYQDREKAAKVYLETHEYDEELTEEALKYVTDKVSAATDYFTNGKFSLKNSTTFLKEIKKIGLLFDLWEVFKALERYELKHFVNELYEFFWVSDLPENCKIWIENDMSLWDVEEVQEELWKIKTSKELKEKKQETIDKLCHDWQNTPYTLCIKNVFAKIVEERIQLLEEQETEREKQRRLAEKLTQ